MLIANSLRAGSSFLQSVEMVVRVHEPGKKNGTSEIEREVGLTAGRPELSFGDVARRILRLEAQPHLEKRSARSSGSPKSAAYRSSYFARS